MPIPEKNRDLIFLSYSRQDQGIPADVRQKLLDRHLEGSLWDDTEIRLSEQWDERIRDAMDRAAVVVFILSDNYFRRRRGGGEYILEKELPYFLEHYEQGKLDLLPLYWSPSPYFSPDAPDRAKPFEYEWQGRDCTYDVHRIQALCRNGRLAGASDQDKLDALQTLAFEAERRLEERLAAAGPSPATENTAGRRDLTVELAIDGTVLHRTFRVAGQPVRASPPSVPRALIDDVKRYTSVGVPSESESARLGGSLYQLLFGAADQDGFPRIAEAAWGLEPGSQANTLAVEIDVRCDAMKDDPWPLRLPWNLTVFRGESLAEHCGWSFELVPPGEDARFAQILSPEPPLLLLFDDRLGGGERHAGQLEHYLDQTYGFAADALSCRAVEQIAERVRGAPEPEVLYVYGTTDLDLVQLAGALGSSVPLVVLNLVGEGSPAPPDELVSNRKLILCTHGAAEADRAAVAGHRWLRTFLQEAGKTRLQQVAIRAFGPRARLWSGCAGLQTPIAQARGDLFRRPLIKILRDRVTARREVSDEVATALSEGRGVLGLVAAGTPDDQPGLLPRQVCLAQAVDENEDPREEASGGRTEGERVHPDQDPRMKHITRGPLWLAFEHRDTCLVLIDEIDKAPRDFPNDLLQELDKQEFPHPFSPRPEHAVRVDRDRLPLVLVTSNNERRLPDAFLRRCIVHNIRLTRELMERAVAAHGSDYADLGEEVRDAAIARFEELRRVDGLSRNPGIAELLAWLVALARSRPGIRAEELEGYRLSKLPHLHCLIKDHEDIGILDQARRR